MKIVDGKENLSCIEFGSGLFEAFALSEMGEHLSSSDEVHDEENFLFGLEGVLQLDEEGVVGWIMEIIPF